MISTFFSGNFIYVDYVNNCENDLQIFKTYHLQKKKKYSIIEKIKRKVMKIRTCLHKMPWQLFGIFAP